jgi:Multiubiquitin
MSIVDQSNAQETRTVTIIVNGRPKPWPKNEDISFDQVVALAFPGEPSGDGVQFTVQFSRGEGNKPSGTLVEGQSVKVKDGMEFDVTPTNRS